MRDQHIDAPGLQFTMSACQEPEQVAAGVVRDDPAALAFQPIAHKFPGMLRVASRTFLLIEMVGVQGLG